MNRILRTFALCVALLLGATGVARGQSNLSTTTCPGAGCVEAVVAGNGSAAVQITGTFSGTLQFERKVNDTYVALPVIPSGCGAEVTSTTATGYWVGNVAGARVIRVRFSAYSSGTASVSVGFSGASVGANASNCRTALSFYATAAAAGATGVETAITLTRSAGTGATSSAATFVATSGKRFRITHISVATRGHATATVQTTTFNLRVNTAGACGTTSTPVLFAARSATPATANAWDRYMLPVPEGYELLGDGTLQFCVTAAATYVTNAPTWDVSILGYEY